MIEGQTAKYVYGLPPISLAGGATATVTEIDTKGFDYAEVLILAGVVPATGVATLKVQESDTTGSGFADVSGAAFTALVDADDNIIDGALIDLRKRKRFLQLVIVNGATNATPLAAIIRLSRAEQVPASGTARGFKEQLTV